MGMSSQVYRFKNLMLTSAIRRHAIARPNLRTGSALSRYPSLQTACCPISGHHDIYLCNVFAFTREPPKTKAELREMLTEAVRNTQPDPKRPLKTRKEFAVSIKS